MSTVNAAPLTKSQKKRMKRNKAKTKKAAAEATGAATSTPNQPVLDPLNAHDALRIGLQELGFELVDIDRSIEEMWNADLDYSDMNAVATFMTASVSAAASTSISTDAKSNSNTNTSAATVQTEQKSNASGPVVTASKEKSHAVTTVTDNAVAVTVVPSKSAVSEEESKTVSTAESMSVSVSPPPKEVVPSVPLIPLVPSEKPKNQTTGAVPVVANGNGHNNNGRANSNRAKDYRSLNRATKRTRKADAKAAPPSLKTKLNIVANNDNLMDAIVALTEWIVKAATPLEVKQLCDSTKPCALRTVIRRVIVAPGPRNYCGQLLDLIGSILRIAGIPSTELSMSARALMHTLNGAKSAIAIQNNTNTNSDSDIDRNMSDNIADYVTDTVASYISNAVEKMVRSCGSSNLGFGEDVCNLTVEQLGAELARVKSSVVQGGGSGVGGLVARRDQLKNLALKHSKILNVKMSSSSPSLSLSLDGQVSNSNFAKKHQLSESEMMAQVLGSKYEEVSASKAKYDELKKRQVESHASLSERQEIVSNIDALVEKKGGLSQKIKQMELELKRLNAEASTVEEQITRAQDSLVVLDQSLSTEAKEVEKSMRDVAQNIKLNDAALDVVHSLQNFHKEMDSAVSAEMAAASENESSGAELQLDLSPYMASFLTCTNDYFNSEYKLVSFLQQRVQKLRDGFPRLEREIEECTGLGMTSNVVEMKKKLHQMQQNIADDDNIIKALQKEAEEMKSALAGIMRQYKETGADTKTFDLTCKEMESIVSAIV